MSNPRDAIILFALLTFFHLWGGAGIGAGVRARQGMPILWGLLIGVTPLYFGVERLIRRGEPAGLAWQMAMLTAAALLVALRADRLRAWFLHPGMRSLMIGTFIMAAAAVIGVLISQTGAEALSLIVGGLIFLFGAMWFGAGIQQLRGK